MKRALITGFAGFIGSHLTEMLAKKKHTIIGIDNFFNNTVDPKDLDCEIESWSHNIEETVLYDDIYVDIVYHLASTVGPVGVLARSGELAYDILYDTMLLRDFCIDSMIKLVYISTSEIYGDVTDWHEDSCKVFPASYTVRSEYAAGKMSSEIAVVNKAKVDDLKYVIIRPFNVAGPRQKPDFGFVLPRFIIAALTDQPITVYGDGKQRRAFTDVRDICDAICLLGEKAEGIYNIGNPANEMSIQDLAELVLSHVKNTKSKIVHVDPKKLHGDLFEEVPDKMPCIDKLERFGWKPKYKIEQTINDTIEYYNKKIKDEGYYFKVI
jgi:nucleoside-diphosphate-sugar epimerase